MVSEKFISGGGILIHIDNNSSKAIYEQVYDEMVRLILSKALKPDEKLPSVRELAAMMRINPNTIQKAYKSLEEDNYIYTIKGKGNFVKSADELRTLHIRNEQEKLHQTVKALRELGLDDIEVMDMVKNVLK
jgi:GntR family transcriptional regulator